MPSDASDFGREALHRLRGQLPRLQQPAVGMVVDVDKARRDDQPAGVDLAGRPWRRRIGPTATIRSPRSATSAQTPGRLCRLSLFRRAGEVEVAHGWIHSRRWLLRRCLMRLLGADKRRPNVAVWRHCASTERRRLNGPVERPPIRPADCSAGVHPVCTPGLHDWRPCFMMRCPYEPC